MALPEPASNGAASGSFRSGYVAIAGLPNVGKSTLMNRLTQERLAIVTPKPQTTRRKTLGILSAEGFQIVFLDTPGLMRPRYELHRAMLREAREAADDADLILFLADPETPIGVPDLIRTRETPRVLALNKVDIVRPKENLLPLLEAWNGTGLFQELVPISALNGTGVDALLDVLVRFLPVGPALYPPDQIAEQPERFFVGEIIRERLFALYQKEIPYAAEVRVELFIERPGAKDFIEAWIFVEHESQKAILIGKGGKAIRTLGEEARREIDEFLGRPVFLSLRVRVMEEWRRRASSLRKLGYRT